MPTDSTRNWTPPQQAAIDHIEGDLLVSAAAGSGKTAVLAERCARLVCENIDGGCGVEGLLVLTFTEAAANEMRARIANAIREKIAAGGRRANDDHRRLQRQAAMVERASISTLHSFCARTLRQHFHEARIDPAFELIDEDEARLLREDTLEEVLARWHLLPPGPQADAFTSFFDAYAQGRDSACREMVLRVYHMLTSTADPVEYVARSRTLYTPPDGCAATLDRYVRAVIAGQLRLLALSTSRAAAEARQKTGPDSAFTAGIAKAADMIAWAQRELDHNGAAAIPLLRDALSYKWPTCKTMADVPDFESLKKRAWKRTIEDLKKFCNDTLAADPADMTRDLLKLAAPLDTLLALVDDFTAAFTAAKRAQNRLDFADLERLTLNLLTAPGSLAAIELRSRYHHLLVDEFQDINPLQEALLHAVRSPDRFDGRGNLFVVGDVKQSIYGFRLANPALFLHREQLARTQTTDSARRYVALPHNFRTHANLLHTMNGLFEKLLTPEIAGLAYADGHILQPSPTPLQVMDEKSLRPFDGNPLELHLVIMQKEEDDDSTKSDGDTETSSDATTPPLPENLSAIEEEARMVADRIAALMQESRGILQKDGVLRPLAYRDIAILLRSMKNKAMIFARALANRGIPVHADLATGYFDTPEVRDTLALLHILDNPRQDIPLATLLLGPYGRFSHDDLAAIRLTYDRKTVSFADAVHRYPDFGHAMHPAHPDAGHDIPPFDEPLAGRLRAFFKKIAAWREHLRTRPLHEGLADIYSDSKILPYLSGLDAGTQRVANLQALHQRALRFAGFNKQGLHRFLRFIEKLRDQDGDFGEAPVLSEASNVVRIMSVHKSKGLEFPVIIVSGLGSQLNLHDGGGGVTVHRDIGIGLAVVDVDRNIQYPSAASAAIADSAKRHGRAEELRLLYVALTRAREHLILTGHLNKSDTLDAARAEWADHAGPLPEDKLLKGRSFLDWLLPTLASSHLNIQWPESVSTRVPCPVGQGPGGGRWACFAESQPQITITTHTPTSPPSAAAPTDQPTDNILHDLLAPHPESPLTTPVQNLLTRITATYPHEARAHQPAVRTVSELKSLATEDPDAPALPLLPHIKKEPAAARIAKDDPLIRGLATHRLLQLLDFTRCQSPAAIAEQLDQFLAAKKIAPDEAAIADLPGIIWFLTATPTAARLIAAANRHAAGDTTIHIRREIPFTWAAPLAPHTIEDPADHPTIRGTIDLLLVHSPATAEILDYKTDSPFTWQNRLPEYQQQMHYYLRAATDILGFPVPRATLIFLSARQTVEVTHPPKPTS